MPREPPVTSAAFPVSFLFMAFSCDCVSFPRWVKAISYQDDDK
jgi:hypothetical protein